MYATTASAPPQEIPKAIMNIRREFNRLAFTQPTKKNQERNTYTVFGDPQWMADVCRTDSRKKIAKSLDRFISAVKRQTIDFDDWIALGKVDYDFAFDLLIRPDIAAIRYDTSISLKIEEIENGDDREMITVEYRHYSLTIEMKD